MWVGIGIGINRNRYAKGIFNAYSARVVADGGVTEAGQCVDAGATPLLQTASLLLIPSGYEGGKLYSEIPTNGNGDLTWTRGSDAFRTNASGLLQRVPWNLATDSENFSAVYSGINASISNNTTSAPNATTTADSLLETTANDIHAIYTDYTQQSGVQYTYSVYVKSISGRNVRISGSSGFTGPIALVDLSNGSLLSGSTGASVESVGNGWYRISLTATTTTTTVRVIIYSMNGTATTFAGSTSNGVYVWGAQIVEGSSAETYLPTTDRLGFPRLDYTYGSCPSALLEPQRTNLALYSAQFDDAYWSKLNSTLTANTVTSPDGTTNADTFTADGSNNFHLLQSQLTINFTTVAFSASVYAKKNTNDFIQLSVGSPVGGMFANFNINNGTLGSVGTVTGTNPTSSIQNVGNGWYRCVMNFTPTLANATAIQFGIITSATSPRIESNTLTTSVYVYGSQVETGAYPSTYIPTTTATATRVADSFSRNNIFTNGLITSSGGTWFVEFRVASTSRDNGNTMRIGDASNAFNIAAGISGTGYGFILNKSIGGTGTNLYFSFLGTSAFVKLAIKWNGTTADVFANGTKVVSATAFTPTNLPDLTGSFGTPIFIKQMALYPSPLSDTDCTTLTTL